MERMIRKRMGHYYSLIYNVLNIENTIAWIKDTDISKIINKVWAKKIIGKILKDMIFPIKHNSRCPEIKFAVRRIANVNGRIIFLIDSIITMKGNKI